MKPIVALTVGDRNGIGPEIILKSLRDRRVQTAVVPMLVGPAEVFAWYARRLKLPFRPSVLPPDPGAVRSAWTQGFVPVIEPPGGRKASVRPGVLSASAGRLAARATAFAVELILAHAAEGLVTAPVSKKALHLAGVNVPGQTEMVQRLSGGDRVAMMLVSRTLKVGLATTHLPLRSVAGTLNRARLEECILVVEEALRVDWNISRPRLAVLGLNPHAGENGDLGVEEQRIIEPVLDRLRTRGFRLAGPFPADAFFARYRPGTYDAVLAMYHDQGLIPLKMQARGRGVNVSVGLPVVRTSPDHGTAFDIAGTGTASAASMIEAILLAALFIRNRRRSRVRRSPEGYA